MQSLQKRNSWPPLRIPRKFYMDEKIDEDPFAYFISPAEDRDVFFESNLAAGIDRNRTSRSLSPSDHKHRRNRISVAKSPTFKLKRWIEKMERQYFHRGSPSHRVAPPEPPKPPETVSPPLRGRRDRRTGSSDRVTNNIKSPQRRPRAWREPSIDIWPVLEEAEDVGLGINVLGWQGERDRHRFVL